MTEEIKEVTLAQKKRLEKKGLNRYEIHMSDELMRLIEDIAVEKYGAKTHHISGKPVIRETVINLLYMGINAINDGVEPLKKFDSDNGERIPIDVINNLIDERLKPILDTLSVITDKINRNSITNNDDLVGTEKIESELVDKILDSIEPEPELVENKPELPTESVKKENTPKKENRGKGGNRDKVMQYINSLPNGSKVKNVTTFAKDVGLKDGSFFSPSKKSGIKIWEQYFIAGKDDNGEDCYILNKPE